MDAISSLVPPHSVEAEQSVLGALLIDQDAMLKVADSVRPEDFYRPQHGTIYRAMLDLFEHREPIDALSVAEKLRSDGTFDDVGGSEYLTNLAQTVPTASHVGHYASIVAQKSTLRRLIGAAQDIQSLGRDENTDLASLLDRAEQKLFTVSQRFLTQNFLPIKDVLTDTFERIDLLHREGGSIRGLPTGFSDLDSLLAGLQDGNLVILAARPSMGKTSFALDIARHVAIREGKTVGIFSLEMSKEEVVDRLLCAEARVSLWKMRTGKLSSDPMADDFPKIGQAMATLSDAPLFIDDSATANIMEIRAKARRLKMEHGLGLIVVDYLQLMEGRSTDNRVQEVSEISRALKGLARELRVPVIALSQLSRAVENRVPQIPQLSDLRESGSIEQDADVVMFIYREEQYKPDTTRRNLADILIKKHRNGPTGQVELYFNGDLASFHNLEKRHTVDVTTKALIS